MKEYVSKQVAMNKPSAMPYTLLSNFDNFKQMLPPDSVEDFESHGDTCSFTVPQIGKVSLEIIEKQENKLIKITSPDQKPFEFFLWVQFVEVSPTDTRMRLTLKVKLNMMMKMLLKGKLQKGLDKMAEQIALAFSQIN